MQARSAELGRRNRTRLDSRWTLCPAGGVDKVAAFLSLFGGNKLHIAVLVDYAQGQKGKVEALRKSELLGDGHIFTTADFCSQGEADVEDFFGVDLYVELVNAACALTDGNKLTPADVQAVKEPSLRVVKKLRQFFACGRLCQISTITSQPCGWFKIPSGSPKTIRYVVQHSTVLGCVIEKFAT